MEIKRCINCFAPLKNGDFCPHCGLAQSRYTPQSHHLPPETILRGRYLVGKALGEGGFGITYSGFDLSLERRVAIKEFFPGGNVWREPEKDLNVTCYSSQNYTEAFEKGKNNCMKEAKSLAQLDDIGAVVRVLDYFLENNTAYVIMEFVEGVTLKEYVQNLPEKPNFQQSVELLFPVMRALDTIHKRGFVHRDVSPDNIMISTDGKAKLLDFGAVKAATSAGNATENPIIKRGFSPLEQYSTSGLIGPWTDVYSVCASLYYLLTGSSVDEPMDRLSDAGDHIADKLQGKLSENELQILLQGLAVQPNQRTQSMEELLNEIDGVMPKPVSEPAKVTTKQKLKYLIPSVAAVAVVLAVLIGVLASRNGRANNYVYGRNPANMFSDGFVMLSGDYTYISDKYDSENGRLLLMDYSKDKVAVTNIAPYSFSLNYLNNTLYFIPVDGDGIYSYTSEKKKPERIYPSESASCLMAVDIGEKDLLFFIEASGGKYYLRSYDLSTKESFSLTPGYEAMIYIIYDGTLYYEVFNSSIKKYEIRSVEFDGKNDKCLITVDDSFVGYCFYKDRIYYQKEGEGLIEATLKGKQTKTIDAIKSAVWVNCFGNDYWCPPLAGNDRIYYISEDTHYLSFYDLKKEKVQTVRKGFCADYEFYSDELLFLIDMKTNMGKPCLYTDKGETIELAPWDQMETKKEKYGVQYASNAINDSQIVLFENTLYFISEGNLYSRNLKKGGGATALTSNYKCRNLNVDEDGTCYVTAKTGNQDAIQSSNAKKPFYYGRDIHCMQYYNCNGIKKLFFTDKDRNGKYYVFSINTDGTALTKLSSSPCAPDSLAVRDYRILFISRDKKRLYLAYPTGRYQVEIYRIFNENNSICQATLKDNLVYVSVNKGTTKNVFLEMKPDGTVLGTYKLNISNFVLLSSDIVGINADTKQLCFFQLSNHSNTDIISHKKTKSVNVVVTEDKEGLLVFKDKKGREYLVLTQDYTQAIPLNYLV